MIHPSHFWHLHGEDQNGPTVLVMGGVHGDELTGIELVEHVAASLGLTEDRFGLVPTDLVRGNLFLGFGNPEAMDMSPPQRGVSERDLNRRWIPEELAQVPNPADPADLVRARELKPVLDITDFMFDIHGTSSPSTPFVCFGEDSPAHREYYQLIPVRYVLTDPDNILAQDFGLPTLPTTDYWVNVHGGSTWGQQRYRRDHGLGFCYETGQRTDSSKVRKALAVTMRLLLKTGVVDQRFIKATGLSVATDTVTDQTVYKLAKCVQADHPDFTYVDEVNRGWRQVEQGELLGHYGNGEEVRIPRNGMLLFPTPSDRIKVGRSMFYIAERIA